jgi:type II secretory pathway component PulF
VLGAAERSGRLEKALAVLANARNLRAHLLAVVLAQLAYPVFILVFAVAIGLFVTVVFGGSATRLGLWLVTGIVSASVCVWALARAVRRGRLDPARVPLLGAWLTELAEISYLRVLHGLYAAGVPIRTAVAEAARVPPFAIARTRTLLAASLIDEGKSLAESYERSRAVQPETQRLLAAAERAGDLEDALGRVLQRRQESFDARSRRICATLVVAVTGLAFLVAGYVIVSFYRSYFAALGR